LEGISFFDKTRLRQAFSFSCLGGDLVRTFDGKQPVRRLVLSWLWGFSVSSPDGVGANWSSLSVLKNLAVVLTFFSVLVKFVSDSLECLLVLLLKEQPWPAKFESTLP
jgi:hypothetical protein